MNFAKWILSGISIPALWSAGPDTGAFRAQSSLVLVNVSVLDSRGRPINDLLQSQFRVLDNGTEQPIASFSHEDGPISFGIILDTSGSMADKWGPARAMLARFCDTLDPQDEVFMATVDGRARLIADFTRDCAEMQNSLIARQPHGLTALLDAVPLAIQHLRQARNPRRVILIISDGGENASRVRFSEIRRLAREANVQIYAAAIGSDTQAEPGGHTLLRELTEITGGRYFEIEGTRHIARSAEKLAREIHDQYVIGFRSPDTGRNGRYRRISVRLRDVRTRRLSLFYRAGYRAAAP